MSAGPSTPATRPRPGGLVPWLALSLAAPARGLAFCGLAVTGAGLLLTLGATILLPVLLPAALIVLRLIQYGHFQGTDATGGLVLTGLAVMAGAAVTIAVMPQALLATRRLASLTRRLAGRWCAVTIPEWYRALPGPPGRRHSVRRRLIWLAEDPATWRDLRWLAVNAAGGWVLPAAPAALVILGVLALLEANDQVLALAAVAGLVAGPWLLRRYGRLAHRLLAPTGEAELAAAVTRLTQTRAEAIDAGAAELRRIERDLHDGAQARLVAMGMTLDAASHVIEDNPAAARALVLEARDSSAKALAELRDLVRGIHPPVLADRGLADAVRALALDSPMRVTVAADLPGRPPAPVESAGYFAVSELLANAAKHAPGARVWVDLRHRDGTLRIGVTDDGPGGADPAAGGGLAGIERRLAAFDGVLAVTSPVGGPTAVTMEIPCVLSSQKTSSC